MNSNPYKSDSNNRRKWLCVLLCLMLAAVLTGCGAGKGGGGGASTLSSGDIAESQQEASKPLQQGKSPEKTPETAGTMAEGTAGGEKQDTAGTTGSAKGQAENGSSLTDAAKSNGSSAGATKTEPSADLSAAGKEDGTTGTSSDKPDIPTGSSASGTNAKPTGLSSDDSDGKELEEKDNQSSTAGIETGESSSMDKDNNIKLDGAWEPSYIGPRVEIEGNRLIRLWRSAPVLETNFTTEERDGRLYLLLADTALRYASDAEPYATIKEVWYENGALTFVDDFPISGESSDVLRPTTNSRYGNVTLVTEAVLPDLQGKWIQTDAGGADGMVLIFDGSRIRLGYGGTIEEEADIVIVRNNYDSEIRIVDADPSKEIIGWFDDVRWDGSMISCRVPVMDAPSMYFRFVRAEEEPPIPTPGGTDDFSDPNAPKTVGSTDITCFDLEASMLQYSNINAEQPFYTFHAEKGEGGVTASCYGGTEPVTFTADRYFLAALQDIVARYDLAQYNGMYRETHGLPENFGSSLHIIYASGEKISASDNSIQFLPFELIRDLVRLFENTAATADQ